MTSCAITSGCEVNLMEVLDPHTVAGLLKLHFREQKASLIPRGLPLSYLMMHVKNRDVSPASSACLLACYRAGPVMCCCCLCCQVEAVAAEFEKLEVTNVATLSIVIEVLAKVSTVETLLQIRDTLGGDHFCPPF